MKQKQKEGMSIAEGKSSIHDAALKQKVESSYQGALNTKVNQIDVQSFE